MAALVTTTQVKDYVFNQRSITIPAGLTDPILTDYVTYASADVLQWVGLVDAPAAGVRLDSLKSRCLELVMARIDTAFFGLDRQAAEAIEVQVRRWAEAIRTTEAQSMDSPIQIKVAGGTGA